MGFFKQTKEQKERKAYRQILSKKTTQAARQAFAEESEKVARERARAKARRPSIGQILAERVSSYAEAKARGTPTRRVARRRAPTRSTYAPVVRRRKTTYRRAPIRRRVSPRRTQPQQPRQPQSLNEAIYGGYK